MLGGAPHAGEAPPGRVGQAVARDWASDSRPVRTASAARATKPASNSSETIPDSSHSPSWKPGRPTVRDRRNPTRHAHRDQRSEQPRLAVVALPQPHGHESAGHGSQEKEHPDVCLLAEVFGGQDEVDCSHRGDCRGARPSCRDRAHWVLSFAIRCRDHPAAPRSTEAKPQMRVLPGTGMGDSAPSGGSTAGRAGRRECLGVAPPVATRLPPDRRTEDANGPAQVVRRSGARSPACPRHLGCPVFHRRGLDAGMAFVPAGVAVGERSGTEAVGEDRQPHGQVYREDDQVLMGKLRAPRPR